MNSTRTPSAAASASSRSNSGVLWSRNSAPLTYTSGRSCRKCFRGGWAAIDAHVVHAIQSRQSLCTESLFEHRPVRAFVDKLVGSHGHDQHIAELPGGLQITDVADVQEIENAVAMDDDPGLAAVLLQELGEFLQRCDLVTHPNLPPRPEQEQRALSRPAYDPDKCGKPLRTNRSLHHQCPVRSRPPESDSWYASPRFPSSSGFRTNRNRLPGDFPSRLRSLNRLLSELPYGVLTFRCGF